MDERAAVRQAKESAVASFFSRPNVVGLGVGFKETRGVLTDTLSVVVLVRQKVPFAGLASGDLVPRDIGGIPTDVIQVGQLVAQQARTDRWRPAPGGVSIGHFKVSAGTFGAVVRDRATGQRLILSNNHVLANSDDAAIGDPILQPGTYDGGQAGQDIIGHLERFCELSFSSQPGTCSLADTYAMVGNMLARLLESSHRVTVMQINPSATNLVDAAVARPVNDGDILDEILQIGEVSGTTPAELGMAVRKSGRTTGYTTGMITVLDATVDVNYGGGRTARFENQLVAGAMSQGGDSGSLLVAAGSQQAVGLLFAGSDQSTIFNPIQAVLDCLAVSI
jgi:hypothetical protein